MVNVGITHSIKDIFLYQPFVSFKIQLEKKSCVYKPTWITEKLLRQRILIYFGYLLLEEQQR